MRFPALPIIAAVVMLQGHVFQSFLRDDLRAEMKKYLDRP